MTSYPNLTNAKEQFQSNSYKQSKSKLHLYGNIRQISYYAKYMKETSDITLICFLHCTKPDWSTVFCIEALPGKLNSSSCVLFLLSLVPLSYQSPTIIHIIPSVFHSIFIVSFFYKSYFQP